MTKKKPPKPAHILEKERAEKQAEALRLCLSRLHGKATAHYFVSKIKRALDCEFQEAERYFQEAVAAGKIRQAGRNGAGDVRYFEAA